MRINARYISRNGFPPDEGRGAQHLMEQEIDYNDLIIDVRDCSPALLISAFYIEFVREFEIHRPELVEAVRKIVWDVHFPFQSIIAQKWMNYEEKQMEKT